MARGFGKPGRPPEDRLARQNEIYVACGPLILHYGAKRFSMHEAARAACLSIGGLYHYFPAKRDLVLHGLRLDARDRLCRDYRVVLREVATWSLEHGITEYLEHSARMLRFVHPAVRAAIELGESELQRSLDAGLVHNVDELAITLDALAPWSDPAERERVGPAMRRLALGALLETEPDIAAVSADARLLIERCLARNDALAP